MSTTSNTSNSHSITVENTSDEPTDAESVVSASVDGRLQFFEISWIPLPATERRIEWTMDFDENGNVECHYVQKIHIIGFKPQKDKNFISEDNNSELFIFGVKNELLQ